MMAITDFPRCAAYARGMGLFLGDPEMQDKHYAWLIGDAALSEDELKRIGAEGLPVGEWGNLLPAMDELLSTRLRQPKADKRSRDRLIGMISWCGIKGGTIKDDEDARVVVRALWPDLRPKKDAGIVDLLRLLEAKPKKWRSASARVNLHRVPRKYFGDATNEGMSAA